MTTGKITRDGLAKVIKAFNRDMYRVRIWAKFNLTSRPGLSFFYIVITLLTFQTFGSWFFWMFGEFWIIITLNFARNLAEVAAGREPHELLKKLPRFISDHYRTKRRTGSKPREAT